MKIIHEKTSPVIEKIEIEISEEGYFCRYEEWGRISPLYFYGVFNTKEDKDGGEITIAIDTHNKRWLNYSSASAGICDIKKIHDNFRHIKSLTRNEFFESVLGRKECLIEQEKKDLIELSNLNTELPKKNIFRNY